MSGCRCVLAGLLVAMFSTPLSAQILIPGDHVRIIRPIPIPPRPIGTLQRVRSIDVQADVHDQVAKVRLSQVFQNTSSSTVEAQFIFPLPPDAAVSELTLLYDGRELPGKLLGKEEARKIYESIVRSQRDPALLEYLGRGLFQTSVFPVPGNAERKVEIRFSMLLKQSDGLIDLLLPLGVVRQAQHPIDRVSVAVRIDSTEPIRTIYSPTHSVSIERPDDKHALCKLTLEKVASPDDVRLLFSGRRDPVGMQLITYRPSDKEDGYFMLLASAAPPAVEKPAPGKSTVIVIDRSGSMSGEKMEQVREAVKFFINQLKPDDTFNIVAYDSSVEAFRPELQRVSRETKEAALSFAAGLNAGGGTNIHGGLTTALDMLRDDKRPSYVLFLTDGVPTVGEQDEMKIVAAAKAADKSHARMFNLGVGHDVNSRLLDRLSRELRGQSVYVRPKENIEVSVSGIAKRIASPMLTDLKVAFEFDAPAAAVVPPAISQTYPRQLTDLFHGEQLVWVGRYKQAGAAKIRLTGRIGDEAREHTGAATFVSRSVGESDSFVEKVWATRRVGEIIDELDLKGRNQELIDELVALSKKHGIMTPYTSFLADERVDLADRESLGRRAYESAEQLSLSAGSSGFAQRSEKTRLMQADSLSALRSTAPASEAKEGKPQQRMLSVGGKTFFWRQNRWEDAAVSKKSADKSIKQFSPEYFELASRDNGRLAKYLAIQEPTLISLDGTTYSIEPAGE